MRITKRKKGDLANILTKEFLQEEHYVNKKPLNKIAKEVGCDRGSVANYLNVYKMPVKVYDIFHPNLKEHPGWKGCGDISMSYWKNLKSGAKMRDIDFKITIEYAWDLYLKQSGKCELSGLPIGFETPKHNTASLDRIDSTKPYEIGNVQWIHRDINTMKWDLQQGHFIELCLEIANHQTESKLYESK